MAFTVTWTLAIHVGVFAAMVSGYSTKDEDFMDKEIGDIDLGDND